MKLLRPSDIQTLKNEEAKAEIDQGILLARKIDQLRDTATKEKAQLEAFRKEATETIQAELNEYNHKVQSVKSELQQLEIKRNELLKPLDEEWSKLYQIKSEIEGEKKQFENDKGLLEQDKKNLEREKIYIENIKKNRQTEFDKAQEARLLAETNKRQIEGELANIQKMRSEHSKKYDERLQTISRHAEELLAQIKAQKEYKKTLLKKEKELKLWEQRLLTRDYGEIHRPKQ